MGEREGEREREGEVCTVVLLYLMFSPLVILKTF